jgi:diguanylate cyclase (GGDEF)-like protein
MDNNKLVADMRFARLDLPGRTRGSGTEAGGLGLKSLLALGSGVLVLSLAGVLWFVIEATATRQLEARIGAHLRELAFQLNDKLDRGLYERFHSIQVAATLADLADPRAPPAAKSAVLNWLHRTYVDYSWIGLADTAGQLVAATDMLPEADNVTLEPWFRGGLGGPYLGEGPMELPPVKLSSGVEVRSRRFVDVAAPVMESGAVVAVLGAHLSWAWAADVERSLLAPMRERNAVELMVLKADGTVFLGPPDLVGSRLDVPSVRAAQAGITGHIIASWPNGKTYLTGFSASRGYRSYKGLGWLVLARQDADTALAPITRLRQHLLAWGAAVTGLFVLLGWLGAWWIAAPLCALTAAADRVEHVNDDTSLPASARYAEVASLSRSLTALIAGLREEIAERERTAQALRQSESRYRTLALCDPLTSLPNRALLRDRLERAIVHAGRAGQPTALLILDLDHFKDVNDTLGHPAGDRLLERAAQRLAACVRATDTLARLGGDEFALVITDLHGPTDATHVARKSLATLARPFDLEGQEVYVGASVGIALCPAHGTDPDQLLRHADLALYRAKASGGNGYEFFASEMAAQVAARKTLERDLRRAFRRGELELHFQAERDLDGGRVRSAEALLRWRHHELGWVSPAEFVPVAEGSGLIGPIGAWALREACRQAQAWREAGLPGVAIAVNVSLAQCRRGDLAATAETALHETGLDPRALELEVTESLFLRDEDATALADLRRLRAAGVGIAIDDFGTGYSSLGQLRSLPVDKVKLDKSFIDRLGRDAEAEAIVRAVVALGHGLGLRVTAEGVESEAQLAVLRSAGCDGAQGFVIGPPAPADEFAVVLANETAAGDAHRFPKCRNDRALFASA